MVRLTLAVVVIAAAQLTSAAHAECVDVSQDPLARGCLGGDSCVISGQLGESITFCLPLKPV